MSWIIRSGFERGFEGRSGVEDCPEDVHPTTGKSDDGRVVTFTLTPLAVVEGAAVGMAERAEGGLVEDALEALVAACRAGEEAGLAGLADDRGDDRRRRRARRRSESAERLPASAISSAVSTAPMPGRLRMRAASGWRGRSASSSRSSSASRVRVASASTASSRIRRAVMRSAGTAIACWAAAASARGYGMTASAGPPREGQGPRRVAPAFRPPFCWTGPSLALLVSGVRARELTFGPAHLVETPRGCAPHVVPVLEPARRAQPLTVDPGRCG